MARRCSLTGKGVRTGNNVSHAKNRTRRRFLPNLQEATLVSEALGVSVGLRVSSSALRPLEHTGGLDAYLTDTAADKLPREARRLKTAVRKSLLKKAA